MRGRKPTSLTGLIAGALLFSGVLVWMMSLWSTRDPFLDPILLGTRHSTIDDVHRIAILTDSLTLRLNELESELITSRNEPPIDTSSYLQYSQLDTIINGIAKQVQRLGLSVSANNKAINSFESLLISDAERLVTLPLLKGEIKTVRQELVASKNETQALRLLVAEMNNQNRFLVGTVALVLLAVATSLIIPAVKSLFASRREEQEEGGTSDT